MFIFKDSLKRANPFAPYTSPDGTRYPKIPQELLTEIPEPPAPEDYSEETYYRTEQDDAPYVIYTRKSQEQIDSASNAKTLALISSREQQELLPRVLREYLLDLPGAAQKPWYAKVKALDDELAAQRAKLKGNKA
jgi:hypothetical protein